MSRTLKELEAYLVGHWDFENNFDDSSGNDNDGTPTDIEWKPMSRGMKPLFNGSSSKMVVQYNSELYSDASFTVSIWSSAHPTTNQMYVSMEDYFYIWVFSNNVIFQVKNTAGDWKIASTPIGNLPPDWYQLTGVYTGDEIILYVDGVEVDSISDDTGLFGDPQNDLYMGLFESDSFHIIGGLDDFRFYHTALDATEALALYNSTKEGHGVLRHETSFTHRLSPEINPNTVFATDMHTKNADRTLIDLSGNSNHGGVNGAVRSGGYFTDGMRFDSNHISSADSDSTNFGTASFTLIGLVKIQASINMSIIGKGLSGTNPLYILGMWNTGEVVIALEDDVGNSKDSQADGTLIDDNVYHLVTAVVDRETGESIRYLDGEQTGSVTDISNITGNISSTEDFNVGAYNNGASWEFIGEMSYVYATAGIKSPDENVTLFNSLAVLPIYSFDASRYPANDTIYTGLIPYSHMSVDSGAFKLNLDNQLECTTTGTIKFRNAHQFDGSEYITIKDGSVETSETGSVTYGTVVASITQGSNIITVDMETGDTLDKIDIQFRKEV